MTEPGLRVNGRFYPIPSSFTFGEARTVKRMTGLALADFAAALQTLAAKQDPDVFAAFVWLSMHREDPTVKPEDVDELELEAVGFEGEADDAVPPHVAPAARNGSSHSSAETLNAPPAPNSETTPVASGLPGSDTGAT